MRSKYAVCGAIAAVAMSICTTGATAHGAADMTARGAVYAAEPIVVETQPVAIDGTIGKTTAPAEGITMAEPVPAEPEVDEEELYILSHLICGEAQCYSRECQTAVGSVVLNRVKSKRYPNTIRGVVFQRGQYACTWDGNYNRKPTATNIEVARKLLMYGSQLPDNVIYQGQFKQGNFVYKKIDGEYFCGER